MNSPLQANIGVLLVSTDVEWRPSDLQALVEGCGSAKPDQSAPDAFLRVPGQQLPMYRVWVGSAAKPLLLFIQRSISAHVISVPWDPRLVGPLLQPWSSPPPRLASTPPTEMARRTAYSPLSPPHDHHHISFSVWD